MKGGFKCCKCVGGRGVWGTKCYDNPKFCCKNKTKKTSISNKKTKRKTNKTKRKTNKTKRITKKSKK